MNTFKVNLSDWINANEGVCPTNYTVEVENNGRFMTGSVLEFADYNFEDRDGDIETITGIRVELLIGGVIVVPIYSTKIVLPIEVLKQNHLTNA